MSDTEFILVEEHTRPIITVILVLRNGSLHDPPGLEGLSYLTGQMLSRGAGERNQEQFADAVDFLGSSLSVSTTRQAVTVSGDVLTRNLDTFESLMADLLNAPRFEPEELAKLKRQTKKQKQQLRYRPIGVGNKLDEGRPRKLKQQTPVEQRILMFQKAMKKK